ncbi:hypothetical protein [Streptomyces avidinii]
MVRKIRSLVLGAALVLSLQGCHQAGDAPDRGAEKSAAAPLIPLSEITSIAIADDPLAEASEQPKILAEVEGDQHRVIVYATQDSCGLFIASHADPKSADIHLVSNWPSGSEGSDAHAAGPFNAVSGAGGSALWASMMCGRHAVVVEYTCDQSEGRSQVRGNVSTEQVSDHPSTLRVVVGGSRARELITERVKAAEPPAREQGGGS